MPAGGGSQAGEGVPLSLAGRYVFTLSCSGNWKDRAVEVSFTAISGPPGPKSQVRPAAVPCQAQSVEAEVRVDAATTVRLKQSGTSVMMIFAVVRRTPDGAGYASVGPTLSDMAVMVSDARPVEQPTA
jgi:hypothetical protein